MHACGYPRRSTAPSPNLSGRLGCDSNNLGSLARPKTGRTESLERRDLFVAKGDQGTREKKPWKIRATRSFEGIVADVVAAYHQGLELLIFEVSVECRSPQP